MSAAAVVRSACQALRRPLFPRALMVMERQQPPRFSQRAEDFSVRRFHSSDCSVGKPAETNKATVEDGVSLKLDRILRSLDDLPATIAEVIEEDIQRERGTKVLAAGSIVAGVLAAVYVINRRFFGGDKEEKIKEI